MLTDTITIPVDNENNGNPANQVFTRFEEAGNRSLYIGPSHSVASRNTLGFYRTLPKSNGNFRGVKKTSTKITQDFTVLGVNGENLTAPGIIEVNFSFPVGLTAAQELALRQRVVGLLDHDTTMVPLNNLLMI